MLTDKQELALALVLWKFLRSDYIKQGTFNITVPHAKACFKALDLASKFGVKDEFMEVLTSVPVAEVKCNLLEKWEPSKLFPEEPPPSEPITNGRELPEKRKTGTCGIVGTRRLPPGKHRNTYKRSVKPSSSGSTDGSPPSSDGA